MSANTPAEPCKYCGGSGRHQGRYVMFGPWPDCEFCDGTGKLAAAPSPSPAELWPDDHSPSDPAGGGYSGGDLRGNLRGHVSPAENRNRNISPMTEGTTSPSFPAAPSPAHVERVNAVMRPYYSSMTAEAASMLSSDMAAAFAQVKRVRYIERPPFNLDDDPPDQPPPAVGQRESAAKIAKAIRSDFHAWIDGNEDGQLSEADVIAIVESALTSSRAAGFAAGIEAAAVKAHEAYAEYWRLSNEQGNRFRAWQAQNSEADGEQVGDMPDGGPGASLPDFIASAIRLIEEEEDRG